jgi:predicted kinase
MVSCPALVVVSGPPGSGKTTLAHEVARAVGCPAICRDEIKEGMAHATPGFAPGPGDTPDCIRRHLAFDRVSLDAPWIEVDTTSGYRPGIAQVVAFINGS